MASTNWSVPKNVTLKWREWDGDFVVFNPASGDTHFLNGIAGAVVKLLESRPASFEAIVAELEDASGETLDRDLTEHLGELLEKLDAAGLIAPVSR